MSAPAEVVRVRLSGLPEYEPPLRSVPPDPAEPEEPADLFRLLAPPVAVAPPVDVPVWDEAGRVRDQLRQLVCLILEVLDGRRKVEQLRGVLDPQVHAALQTRLRGGGAAGRQHRLRTLHTCRPAEGIIELCGTVAVSTPTGRPSAIALAARVERRGRGWRCTALRPMYPGPKR
jgi:Family of unknown function (DUF6459)